MPKSGQAAEIKLKCEAMCSFITVFCYINRVCYCKSNSGNFSTIPMVLALTAITESSRKSPKTKTLGAGLLPKYKISD